MRSPLLCVLVAVAAACGTNAGATPTDVDAIRTGPTPTIGGVGQLPNTIPREREPLVVFTRPIGEDGEPVALVGDTAGGNRLLMIGDSILASTAIRYGGEMCGALVPLGWQVAVDAEPGRFIEFGNDVLDRRLTQAAEAAADENDDVGNGDAGPSDAADIGWDAAVIFLGSNYASDREFFAAEMREIVERLAPQPTVLVTVTEYRSSWAEVNDVVRALAAEYDNVSLADWNLIARTPGVLSRDGLHPTDAGEQVLADLVVATIGAAPDPDDEGECLDSPFTDDSLVGGGGGAPASAGSSTGFGSGSSGGSRGSSGSGSSSSGGSSGSSSSTGSSGSSSGSSGTSSGGSTGFDSTGFDSTGGDDTTGFDTTGGDTSGGSGDSGFDTTGGDSSGDSGFDTSGSSSSGDGSSSGTTSDGTSTDGSSGSSGSTGGSDSTAGSSTTGSSTTGSSTTGSSTTGSSTTGSSTTDSSSSGTTSGSTGTSTSGTSGASGTSTSGSSGGSTTGGTTSGSSGSTTTTGGSGSTSGSGTSTGSGTTSGTSGSSTTGSSTTGGSDTSGSTT